MNIRYNLIGLFFLVLLFMVPNLLAQGPATGENEYRLAGVNPQFTGTDTITSDGGRGIWVAHDPDLDGDGNPEILVTEYSKGGRVFVYEMVGDDQLEFVWASKELGEGSGPGSTPRSVTTGDFDNNGLQEIIFPIGHVGTDSLRGLYFYEFTGIDNDYGTEPVFKMTYEFIDPAFANSSQGRTESGITVKDIDGDGKSELLFPPRQAPIPDSKLYILEVESGTFAGGDAVIDHEYIYDGMVNPSVLPEDSYTPCGLDIGDVDKDGFDEIIVLGWTTAGSGAGLGFIQISGPDTYTNGSVLSLNTTTIFWVKAKPLFAEINGEPVIYIHGTSSPELDSWMYIVSGIILDNFVTPANISELFLNVGYWSAWDLGDQDHPTNDPGDGLDIYLNGGGGRLLDIEYDGSGEVTDTASYEITEVYDLSVVYDTIGGLWNDVYTRPGLDLDNDGLRDLVVAYKGAASDSIANVSLAKNGFHVYFFEWGDSTQSIDLDSIASNPTGFKLKELSIIAPDDYVLEQNYPNPFNPSTTIAFTLPISKQISLKIYNALGQEVRTLVNNEQLTPGRHVTEWDGKDNHGNTVASGIYIYTLKYGNFSKSLKMSLLR